MSLTKFKLVEITSIVENNDYAGDTWDLEVEEDHSYNIDGVIVHNSQCTTRYVAGVGIPQLSAIFECADAAHGLGGLICADGGITCPGDVMKAFGGGADLVMIGGEFAGHDESGGDEVYDDGVIMGKITYGMSSGTAMKKYNGGVNTYRSSEGRTSVVPYRGPLSTTIEYYLGGLRSGMTYIGAKSIKEISKRATFVRVGQILNSKYESSTTSFR